MTNYIDLNWKTEEKLISAVYINPQFTILYTTTLFTTRSILTFPQNGT